MEIEVVKFYLQKIENKAKVYFLSSNESTRNDLLNYIEVCIEICNLLKKRFNQNVENILKMFQDIQTNILLRDLGNAITIIQEKKKELEKLQNISSSI